MISPEELDESPPLEELASGYGNLEAELYGSRHVVNRYADDFMDLEEGRDRVSVPIVADSAFRAAEEIGRAAKNLETLKDKRDALEDYNDRRWVQEAESTVEGLTRDLDRLIERYRNELREMRRIAAYGREREYRSPVQILSDMRRNPKMLPEPEVFDPGT